MTSPYRDMPSVDRVLNHPRLVGLLAHYDRGVLVALVREQLDAERQSVTDGEPAPSLEQVVERVISTSEQQWQQRPIPVINATGVVLHTNLGRAPLSTESLEAMVAAARGYSSLEMDMDEGRRGSRHHAIAELLRRLTGAEDAMVVNNNAGAVLLGLAAVTTGKQVLVSRSEAVEIGGGFRVPDVLGQSGAHLKEVGTTNRTYARDYDAAISSETGAVLSVHRSNFQIIGFTNDPSLSELVELAHAKELPLLHDLGSGALLDTAAFGLTHEPMPQESVAAGADLVFFSGDKLLGGPQSGIVVGRREFVQRLMEHPLARALRIDKLSLSALHATLLHYLRGEATERVPIWRMVSATIDGLEVRARGWATAINAETHVLPGFSTIGGGSLPGEVLDTRLLGIDAGPNQSAQAIVRALREQSPPVIARIEEGRVLLDPRTVLEEQDELVRNALCATLGQ